MKCALFKDQGVKKILNIEVHPPAYAKCAQSKLGKDKGFKSSLGSKMRPTLKKSKKSKALKVYPSPPSKCAHPSTCVKCTKVKVKIRGVTKALKSVKVKLVDKND